MNRKQKWYILGTIFCILLGIQLLVNVTWFDYWHGNVKYEYNAKIKQCENILNNYNDKQEDLINYERTATDSLGIVSSYILEKCLKLTSNPDRFLRGKYGEFWVGNILINIMIFAVILLILGLIYVISFQ